MRDEIVFEESPRRFLSQGVLRQRAATDVPQRLIGRHGGTQGQRILQDCCGMLRQKSEGRAMIILGKAGQIAKGKRNERGISQPIAIRL